MVYKQKKTRLIFYQLFAFLFLILTGINTAALAQMTQEEAIMTINNFFDTLPPGQSSGPLIGDQFKKIMEELIVKAAKSGLTEMEVAKIAQAAANAAILKAYQGSYAPCIVPWALAAGAVSGAAKAGMNPTDISLAATMGMVRGVKDVRCEEDIPSACGSSNQQFRSGTYRQTWSETISQCPCPKAVWEAAYRGARSEALSKHLVNHEEEIYNKFCGINFLERDTIDKTIKESEEAVQEFITNSPSF